MLQYIDHRLQEQGQSFAGQFAALGDQLQHLTAALGATTLHPNHGGRPGSNQQLPAPRRNAPRGDQREHFQGQQPPALPQDGLLPRPVHNRPQVRAPATFITSTLRW